jgi:hypothetical protein
MNKRLTIAAIAALMLGAVLAPAVYMIWSHRDGGPRASMLLALPANASTIVFADFAELRQSPFAAQLYAWAPRPQIDADYAQFLHDTNFDYERDLDRVAIAAVKHAPETAATFFVIADGRFDRKKIVVYASQSGTHEKRDGREIFSVSTGAAMPSGKPRKFSFTFLRNDRMALVADGDLAAFLSARSGGPDAKDWRERFERLAGSPVFAVVRQDAAPGSALAVRAPGGLQSPQLSSLLDQLQWITIAGKPEGDLLRVVAEGECGADACARQLTDMLNGLVVMAQAGLNGPQVRQQLDPQARAAYLDMLKSTDVQRINRGETKSVRVTFDVSPTFLRAVGSAVPARPPSQPAPATTDPPPAKSTRHK